MQKVLQLLAAAFAMFWLAPWLYQTPLNHWTVYAVVGVAAAYGVAWLTAHCEPLRRGRADTVPGIRPKGAGDWPIR